MPNVEIQIPKINPEFDEFMSTVLEELVQLKTVSINAQTLILIMAKMLIKQAEIIRALTEKEPYAPC